MAAQTGVEGFFEIAWEEFEAGRRGDIFDRTLERLEAQPRDCSIPELVEVYRNHKPSISLAIDAKNCLDKLHGEVALALITDGPLASQQAKTEALGLDEWIGRWVFTAELGSGFGKPHPRAFEIVEDWSGYEGNACLYMADNPRKDFAGPKSLGWKTVRIRRSRGIYSHDESGKDVDVEFPLIILEAIPGIF